MNRTDRLLAIVIELQRHKHRRAEDLAATFEVNVRTIYRDIQALAEAGIPISAMTGYGYTLVEGYFLPPLNFTADEALMLILGSNMMQQNFDAQYRFAAQTASHKIEAVLPSSLQDEVDYLRQNIAFFGMKGLDESKLKQLSQLRRAIVEHKVVRLTYAKRFFERETDAETTREIAPYGLASLEHDWYVMAYCYLRREVRVFRLSRIDHLEVLDTTFQRPRNFVPNWIHSGRPRSLIVRILVNERTIRWVRESRPFSLVKEDLTPKGWLLTFQVQHEDELLQWILGWGQHVQIVEPETLRLRLVKELEQMLKIAKGY